MPAWCGSAGTHSDASTRSSHNRSRSSTRGPPPTGGCGRAASTPSSDTWTARPPNEARPPNLQQERNEMHAKYQTVDDNHVLRFERTLAHPIDAVWRALTEPA